MGVGRGLAETSGDQPLEVLGEHVLEDLGLLVDPIPRHPELLREKQLQQPVMAQNLERHAPALRRETDAAIALVLHESQFGELADHRRDRSRRDAEPLGELGRRDGGPAARLERVDRLRVILDRRRD